MPPSTDIKITIYVDLPWHSEPIVKSIDVESIHERSLHPLPRDREIIPESAKEATHQTIQRKRLIDLVSGELAQNLKDAILEAVESRDPQHGYSPEEWEKMHRAEESS